MATATASEAKALGYNLQVDYVIHYSFGNGGKCRTVAGWQLGDRDRGSAKSSHQTNRKQLNSSKSCCVSSLKSDSRRRLDRATNRPFWSSFVPLISA